MSEPMFPPADHPCATLADARPWLRSDTPADIAARVDAQIAAADYHRYEDGSTKTDEL